MMLIMLQSNFLSPRVSKRTRNLPA
ncbi:unnamed protein product [Spirodela intermedia]|uniref:Uncharacterized protein n=1 Tax=Spirodela intermedia TaxID=51605 RepID=A0A7I8I7E8_SPIIN|nr:unnamed protein product [Spirodela intermedia]CAA6653419.1 unnamed protein product [Spirodela intermedia]